MVNVFLDLLSYSGKYKYLFILGCVLSAISAIFLLIPFIYIYQIIEQLLTTIPNYNSQLIQNLAFSALIFALSALLINFVALMCTHFSAFENEKNMKNAALEHLLKLPLGYFSTHTSGSLRKIIEYSTSQTESFLAHLLPDLVAAITTPIVFFIMLFYFDWKLGIVCIIPLIVAFISIARMFADEHTDFMMQYQTHLENMNSEAVEYLRGIPVTKTFQQTIYSYKNFHDSIINYGKFVKQYSFSMQLPMTTFTLSVHGFFILLIPVGILLSTNPLNVHTLLNLIFYMIFTPICGVMINKIMNMSQAWMTAKQALDKINEILNETPLSDSPNKVIPKNNNIKLNNIVFDYEKDDDKNHTINNLSLTINEGETVALVGPSGGGKTTIAQLINRFWDVDSGSICIGGINIKEIPHSALNDKISFVFQDSNLFKDTIYNNITMGRNFTNEEVMDAIKEAQCEEIINKLPNGLDTIVKEEGLYLSGGEQQRISLARALLKDAPIIILDEATAFTDPENELQVQKAINQITKNKTVLIIAHRLSTIRNVDRIFVINEGKLVESGTHEELLNNNGLFSKMWNEYNKAVEWKIDNAGEIQ
ncbi:MAG: ABC transporter ATP-binding protein [Methanosphaera stadtmanae]|nr:ABC transporter ATP-binding protein [Methanosphaera stadtmanae]